MNSRCHSKVPGWALGPVAACGALLMMVLPVAACGGGIVACAGQCSPPYQLLVVFKPHTTPAAAGAELRRCSRGDPNVIRAGKLEHPDNVPHQFTATIYTHHIPKPRADTLQKCLAAQPDVLNAGWPG